MATDILIRRTTLTRLERSVADVTAVPDDASLISEADWIVMCNLNGGEAALMESLQVIEELQDEL